MSDAAAEDAATTEATKDVYDTTSEDAAASMAVVKQKAAPVGGYVGGDI